MRYAAQYAVVKFLPFVETGEFANVGVVLFSPTARFFGYRLMTTRHARITAFFEQVDGKVFRAAIKTLKDELDLVAQTFKRLGTDRRYRALDAPVATGVWQEIVKPRETMLRCGTPRLVVTEDVETKLRALYQYYVERNFVTREYQEQVLERAVRGWLSKAHIAQQYLSHRIGNDEYSAQFPFVALDGDRPAAVIKPLNLNQPDASRIIDHGGQWAVRVKALRKRNLLPEAVLFAVEGPNDQSSRGRALTEVVAELEDHGVLVTRYQDRDAVVAFAVTNAPHPNKPELGVWSH